MSILIRIKQGLRFPHITAASVFVPYFLNSSPLGEYERTIPGTVLGRVQSINNLIKPIQPRQGQLAVAMFFPRPRHPFVHGHTALYYKPAPHSTHTVMQVPSGLRHSRHLAAFP